MSFKDGGLVTIKDPSIEISGLTYGDRTHCITGALVITDHINKLEATVTYNPPKPAEVGGLMKSFKKKLTFKKGASDAALPTDTISIQICQKALNGKD